MVFGASYVDVHARMPALWACWSSRRSSAPRSPSIRRSRTALLADRCGRRSLLSCVSLGGSVYAGDHPALRRRAERAGARDAVHRRTTSSATRAAFGLDQRRGAAALRRSAAHARRPRAQRRDDRERAAVERSAAARHVRPDPGDPHLLRLRLGRQRPLHDRRQVPADHAVGARAELAQPAEPHLDQRAADVHARLWPHARARSTR